MRYFSLVPAIRHFLYEQNHKLIVLNFQEKKQIKIIELLYYHHIQVQND